MLLTCFHEALSGQPRIELSAFCVAASQAAQASQASQAS